MGRYKGALNQFPTYKNIKYCVYFNAERLQSLNMEDEAKVGMLNVRLERKNGLS
jgi:hypothetical protein